MEQLFSYARLILASTVRNIDCKLSLVQKFLEFGGSDNYQFQGNGIGKIGTAGFILGCLGGIHFTVTIFLIIVYQWLHSKIIIYFLIWVVYIVFLISFHFLEFYITAVKQPDNLSYESFIISHSKAYTIAASTYIIVHY